MGNRMHRSRSNRVIAGVCGGMGEEWNIEANILRAIFVIGGIFTIGILLYLFLWATMPEEPAEPTEDFWG